MTPSLTLDLLLAATAPGGATCLTSRTELEPAAGPHSAVAPAKFALRGRDGGVYAYEQRFLDGQPTKAVIIDSKQSQLNRAEAALRSAIEDGHPVLSRLPRIEVTYDRDGVEETYSDLNLPHRAFDDTAAQRAAVEDFVGPRSRSTDTGSAVVGQVSDRADNRHDEQGQGRMQPATPRSPRRP